MRNLHSILDLRNSNCSAVSIVVPFWIVAPLAIASGATLDCWLVYDFVVLVYLASIYLHILVTVEYLVRCLLSINVVY